QNLTAVYGPVVATYTLRDALNEKVLCPYTYRTIVCSFDVDEAEEYEKLASEIGGLIAQDPERRSQRTQVLLQSLISRRARLVGALRSKLQTLEDMPELRSPVPHTLFYCGEGYHPLDAGLTADHRIVDQTVR